MVLDKDRLEQDAREHGPRWSLDREIDYLNHGSFGAVPQEVADHRIELLREIEREPMRFFANELAPRIEDVRTMLSDFVGADAGGVVFVRNASTAISTVVRSIDLSEGDELLTTDHAYGSARNALEFAAETRGAKVVVASVPFPLSSPDEVVEAVLAEVTDRTRLALLDHITSATALIFPIERLVKELDARGVDTLVDGAHAPGMVPLDVNRSGAAYYTGNGHKWICAPHGAAFLSVREDRRERVRPLVMGFGARRKVEGRSRYLVEFDWTGTDDPTAVLAMAHALKYLRSLLPGGWDELMERNRALALFARDTICGALGIDRPCPDEMIGSIVAFPLPPIEGLPPSSAPHVDALQDYLLNEERFEIPVNAWPAPPARVLRISAQLYNAPSQYERLAAVLSGLAATGRQDP